MLVKNRLLLRMDSYHSFAEKIFTMTYDLMLVIFTVILEEYQYTWYRTVSEFKGTSSLIKIMGKILGKTQCAKRLDLSFP